MHPLLDIQGGTTHMLWASSSTDSRTPGSWWGATPERDEPHVLVHSGLRDGALDPIDTRQVPLKELERVPAPDAFVVEWKMPALKNYQEFGPLLVKQLASKFTPSSGPLVSIHYQDRYLRSPLSAALVYSLVEALSVWGRGSATAIRVDTTFQHGSGPSRSTVDANFAGTGATRTTLEELLLPLSDGSVKVEVQTSLRAVPHARTLTLEWQDGSTLRVHLEQGMGFATTAMPVSFNSIGTGADIAGRLLSLRMPLRANGETVLSGVVSRS